MRTVHLRSIGTGRCGAGTARLEENVPILGEGRVVITQIEHMEEAMK
jgi:hypothetical protein